MCDQNVGQICTKCGRTGHVVRNCLGPVTSFGLIVFKHGVKGNTKGRMYPFTQAPCEVHEADGVQEIKPMVVLRDERLFLLVERKDTMGFLNIVQGAYPDLAPAQNHKLQKYIAELTCEERHRLLTERHSELWKTAGSNKRNSQRVSSKFRKLNLEQLFHKIPCVHREADYLMPKGRLKSGESVLQCALREFAEETGYLETDVQVLPVPPITETFLGTDGKTYRNVFFVAKMLEDRSVTVSLGEDPLQVKEVRNVGWFSLDECCSLLRACHVAKKEMLRRVHSEFPGV